MNPRAFLLATGTAALLLGLTGPGRALAQDDPAALKQRVLELELRNRELEDEVAALQQPADEAPESEPAAAPEIPMLKNVAPDDDDYLFLKLGQDRDYLAAERWRIVDQLEQAIPPLYEPVRPFHGYTLPPGAWRIGLSTTVARNAGDFGRDKFYALFFDHVKVNATRADLDLFYGFELGRVRDLTLRINVPYKSQRTSGTGRAFRIDPMVMTMTGAASGLGDVSLTLKKKWFDQANRSPVTFATMLGAVLPTGASEKQFNASQTIFMNGMAMPVTAFMPGSPTINIFGRTPDDLRFPDSGQPGHGSWGARFGFGVTRQFERSALHAGAVFDLLAKNDGITPGDELRYGASYTLPPLPSDHLAVDLAVFGLWKGAEKFPGLIMHPERDPATGGPFMDASGNLLMFVTPRPDFEHGNQVFFSPTLVYTPRPATRFTLSPSYRLIQPRRGGSPRWMFSAGITQIF